MGNSPARIAQSKRQVWVFPTVSDSDGTHWNMPMREASSNCAQGREERGKESEWREFHGELVGGRELVRIQSLSSFSSEEDLGINPRECSIPHRVRGRRSASFPRMADKCARMTKSGVLFSLERYCNCDYDAQPWSCCQRRNGEVPQAA